VSARPAARAGAVPLPRMQRWMQEVVVHPGAIDEALAARGARTALRGASVDDVILPSRSLRPAERVAVYQGMYLLRMEEALESDYPALKHLLGASRFSALVRDYVAAYPSVTYTLNRLGDHMPDFVAKWKGASRPAVAHDLARLELAMTEVFDADETPPLSEAEIAAVAPEAWERARLTPVAAFRLLSFRYPVNAYFQSVRDESHDHPPLTRKDTYLAIYRRDYTIWRHDLSRPAHDLLADLVAGKPLGKAVASALARGGRFAPTADQLFRWFREWAAGGVFQSVRLR
jgi:putative DNA-binding protein